MEATIKISPEELTPSLLKKIKVLFENEDKLEITIKSASARDLTLNESREEYYTRVNSAIDNLQSNTDTITLSRDEYEKLISTLLNSK
jgi:hypothetical protein